MTSTQTPAAPAAAPVTLDTLRLLARKGERFAGLTAYDAGFARVLDRAGVDFVLVGDSLGMTVQGHDSTVPVIMEDMIYHTACAARGVRRALLMADLPFMSFRDVPTALDNTAALMQEGGAHMVKLEAGVEQVEIVAVLAENGLPVCAHLGLRPQSLVKFGAPRVHGQKKREADALARAARELEDAGADLLLLECVAPATASAITERARIPVIGIGSGPRCDGQVMVLHDLLGLTDPLPRHARDFLRDADGIEDAVRAYVAAVRAGDFL